MECGASTAAVRYIIVQCVKVMCTAHMCIAQCYVHCTHVHHTGVADGMRLRLQPVGVASATCDQPDKQNSLNDNAGWCALLMIMLRLHD
jgi:hypothetical protein